MKCKHAFANNDGGEWRDKHHIYELTEMDCKRCKLREEQKIMENQHIKRVDIGELVKRCNSRVNYSPEGPKAIRSYRAGYNDAMRDVIDMLEHIQVVPEETNKIAKVEKEIVKEKPKEKPKEKEKVDKSKAKTVKKAKRVNTSSIDISYLVSRKQRGLTYEQLGKEFGISQSTAYRLYNDYINQFNKKGDTK